MIGRARRLRRSTSRANRISSWSPQRMRPFSSTAPMRSPSPSKRDAELGARLAHRLLRSSRFSGTVGSGWWLGKVPSMVSRYSRHLGAGQLSHSAATTTPAAPLPQSTTTVSGAAPFVVARQARDIVVADAVLATSARPGRRRRCRRAISPSLWMSSPKNGLPREHHLEAVIVGRVVRAGHHHAAVDTQRRGSEVQHRRRTRPIRTTSAPLSARPRPAPLELAARSACRRSHRDAPRYRCRHSVPKPARALAHRPEGSCRQCRGCRIRAGSSGRSRMRNRMPRAPGASRQ